MHACMVVQAYQRRHGWGVGLAPGGLGIQGGPGSCIHTGAGTCPHMVCVCVCVCVCAWCGVGCGVVRCGAVRCGVVWCGVVWHARSQAARGALCLALRPPNQYCTTQSRAHRHLGSQQGINATPHNRVHAGTWIPGHLGVELLLGAPDVFRGALSKRIQHAGILFHQAERRKARGRGGEGRLDISIGRQMTNATLSQGVFLCPHGAHTRTAGELPWGSHRNKSRLTG
jgi:hypothetical protein